MKIFTLADEKTGAEVHFKTLDDPFSGSRGGLEIKLRLGSVTLTKDQVDEIIAHVALDHLQYEYQRGWDAGRDWHLRFCGAKPARTA